jgi:hypothetical protein
MHAQKREPTRNYIGLVSDEADMQYASQPLSRQPMKDYLRSLLAALREPRSQAAVEHDPQKRAAAFRKDHAQTTT